MNNKKEKRKIASPIMENVNSVQLSEGERKALEEEVKKGNVFTTEEVMKPYANYQPKTNSSFSS